MKFKVGDRVVIARNFSLSAKDITHFNLNKFKSATVKRHSGAYLDILVDGETETYVYEHKELEHEHIFNSPLMKALR